MSRYSIGNVQTQEKMSRVKATSGRSISRILSMTPRRHCAIISLGEASPLRSMRPTRDWPNHRMKGHV